MDGDKMLEDKDVNMDAEDSSQAAAPMDGASQKQSWKSGEESWPGQGQSGDHWRSSSWRNSGSSGWGSSENWGVRDAPVEDWKAKSKLNQTQQEADGFTDDEEVLMPEDSEINGLSENDSEIQDLFDRCRCCWRLLDYEMYSSNQKKKDQGNRACKDCVHVQNNRKDSLQAAKGNRNRLLLMFLADGLSKEEKVQVDEAVVE